MKKIFTFLLIALVAISVNAVITLLHQATSRLFITSCLEAKLLL